jgi:HEPN domain-containing protein
MPNVDFAVAATRHLRDASFLLESGRSDNAFYLCGYIVECSLKAVAGWSGLPPEAFGHQLMKLEGNALDLAMAIAPATARYRPPVASVHAVSSSWSTNYRYYENGVSATQATELLKEAQKVWETCIGEMFLDGLIQELS